MAVGEDAEVSAPLHRRLQTLQHAALAMRSSVVAPCHLHPRLDRAASGINPQVNERRGQVRLAEGSVQLLKKLYSAA